VQKWSQLRHRAAATATSAAEQPPASPDIYSSQDLEREIQLYQVDMKKMLLQIKAHRMESKQLDQSLQEVEQRTSQERQALVELRTQVKRAKRSRSCLEEYEVLAKLANQRPPRRILEEGMNKVQQELTKVKQEETKAAHELITREKQFSLLMQCMLDLKRSLTEPLNDVEESTETPGNSKIARSAQDDDDEEEGAVNEDAMETEETDPLYGDL
jgi:hypothetical protein